MAGETEQDRPLLAFLLGQHRLVDRGPHGMGGLGRRDNPLAARKQQRAFETGVLLVCLGLDLAGVVQLGNQWRLAVIAQTAGMDAGGHEVVAQGVHHRDRRHLGGIAVIEGIDPLGQGRARSRFHRHAAHFFAVGPVGDEREGQSGEVGAAAAAGDHHVRIIPGDLHLGLGLLADHGLVQTDMIQHAAEGIVGVGMAGGIFNRLRDGDSQAAEAIRIMGQDRAAGIGEFGRRRDHLRPPQLHHALAVRLLAAGNLDHIDGAFQTEHGTGQGQRTAPLAGAGLGCQAADAGLLVIVGLGDGRVRFV